MTRNVNAFLSIRVLIAHKCAHVISKESTYCKQGYERSF